MRKRALSLAGLAVLCLGLALPLGSLSRFAKQALYRDTAALQEPVGSVAAVTLHEGDYVRFGHYLGEPVLWRVIAVEGGKPLLFSENVLCLKAFAACEKPLECSSDWQASALRQWLNATEERISWAGASPTAANIYEGHNAYADEPGFLSGGNFTARELGMIDDSGDKVFLLTKKQLKKLPAKDRKKAPTRAALRRDDSPYLFVRPTSWYWTADPIKTNTQSVCSVTGKGSFYQSLAADGMNGVCPALRLKTDALAACGEGSKAAPYQITEGGAP